MIFKFESISGALLRCPIFIGSERVGVHPEFYSGRDIFVSDDIEIEGYSSFYGQSGTNIVSMGAFSYTNAMLPRNLIIGRYSSIAHGIKSMGASHPTTWISTSPAFYKNSGAINLYSSDVEAEIKFHKYSDPIKKTRIGNDVWIGANVSIKDGVNIGDGAVVAANSIVTKDVPPYCIFGGVPAKFIRHRFDMEVVSMLMDLKFWKYSPKDFFDLPVDNPSVFCDLFSKRVESGLEEFRPASYKIDAFI